MGSAAANTALHETRRLRTELEELKREVAGLRERLVRLSRDAQPAILSHMMFGKGPDGAG